LTRRSFTRATGIALVALGLVKGRVAGMALVRSGMQVLLVGGDRLPDRRPRPRALLTRPRVTVTGGPQMRPTEPFRREHRQLLSHIEHIGQAAGEVARLDHDERELLINRILDFLRGTLVPHAKAEEEVLYPEWAKLVGFADAAVPMVHDHAAIVERIERLEQADVDDVDTLQELLYGLHALNSVHFRKEEDIQLPAFDGAPPEVTGAVLERMERLTGQGHAD
jgi:iron-sulfur cluster repair protein YtfE (RIC family)